MPMPHLPSARRSLLLSFALAILCVVAVSVPASFAQTAGTASIQGAVTDSTGAAIAGAKNHGGQHRDPGNQTTTSGGNGLYSFPNLAVGTYSLEVADTGFRTYSQTNIILEVGSSIAINVPMAIGATTERVEVQATGLALQTEDPSFKQTIDEKTVTELPLNGRQVTSLITLSGAAANAPAGNVGGNKTFFSSVIVSVAGGQGNQTDYRLDGGDNNDYMTNINLPFPFPDAITSSALSLQPWERRADSTPADW